MKERCTAAGIDLSTTTQHQLSGAVAVADGDGNRDDYGDGAVPDSS